VFVSRASSCILAAGLVVTTMPTPRPFSPQGLSNSEAQTFRWCSARIGPHAAAMHSLLDRLPSISIETGLFKVIQWDRARKRFACSPFTTGGTIGSYTVQPNDARRNNSDPTC
jgi:hypothetical protein